MTDDTNYDSNAKVIEIAIDNMLSKISIEVVSKFKELETRLDSLDQQVATLVLAYGEQAVFMEALVGQVAFATDDAQNNFHALLKDARKNMLEVMKDGSKTFVDSSDKNVGDAIVNMATEKLSDFDQ
jgi:hypothetical protein